MNYRLIVSVVFLLQANDKAAKEWTAKIAKTIYKYCYINDWARLIWLMWYTK